MGEEGAGAGKAGPLGAPGPGRSRVPHSHDETAISPAWLQAPRRLQGQQKPRSTLQSGMHGLFRILPLSSHIPHHFYDS